MEEQQKTPIDPPHRWPIMQGTVGSLRFTIERMLPKDDGHLLALDWEVFARDRWSLANFCELRRRTFVARLTLTNGLPEIVGYVVIDLGSSTDGLAKIVRLAVRKELRRQHIGLALVTYLTHGRTDASSTGQAGQVLFSQVAAIVADDNLPVHCLLKRCGFRGALAGRGGKHDLYHFERPAGGWPSEECQLLDPKWRIAN